MRTSDSIATLGHMNSNLIPTPRTDKNGVTSIRHMKPVPGASRSSAGIPPVAAPTPAKRRLSDAELVEAIYPDGDLKDNERSNAIRELREWRRAVPDSVAVMETLLTTGTETARSLVAGKISRVIGLMAYSRDQYQKEDGFKTEFDLSMRRISPLALRQYWNCGNVMEESGYAGDSGIPGRVSNVIQKELPVYMPKRDLENADDNFWRAVTAFTITDIICLPDSSLDDKDEKAYVREYNRNAKQFIEYAEKYPDLTTLLRTAVERDTLVVRDLKAIIAAGKKVPSLSDGAL